MKYLIRIKQKGGFQGFPYLFNLDEEGLPLNPVIVKAKNLEDAIDKPSDLEFCKKIGIPENCFGEPYKLE